MKWFSVLIVISLLFVLGGLAIGINPVRVTEGPPRFIFSADKIASWKDIEQGFSIKLTKEAQQEFLELTRNNLNKPVEMYVETELVSSPVILEPIGSDSMMLAVDSEMKGKILSLLPTDKQEKYE